MVSPGNRGSGRWRVAICVGAVNGFGPPAWGFGDGQDWAVSRSAGVAGDPHGRWSLERRAVSVQRRTVDSVIAHPACPGCVPAAVAQACLVADQDLVRAERWPLGHHVGGCVIHFPAVVCTRWPITPSSLGRAGTTHGQDLALGAVPPIRRAEII
jgi:hypothetical protein